jgi:hypothetical protein
VVAIAVASIRAMYCVERATNHVSVLTGEIRQWLGQAEEFTNEAREVVVSAREIIAPLRRVADRFETLGERAADLSAAVLEEVEPPIHTAVSVARGVRSVTAYLAERLSHRFMSGRSATNGEHDNE